MNIKEYELMKRVYGDKLTNLYMLENNGFKIPPFMYMDELYLETKNYKYLNKDEYFSKYLKNKNLVIKTSIFDESHYGKYVFMTYLNKKSHELNEICENYQIQFDNFKNKVKRIFIPGIIIQEMIPNKILYEINMNNLNKSIIIKEKKNNFKDFYFFKKISHIKTKLKKEYNNKLIKVIKKINSLNLNYVNLNLKIILHKKELYIINFDYY